jgi:RNA polymerase primary sigma factor
MDQWVQALLELGERQGHLTHAQLNDHLPESVDAAALDRLFLLLDEKKIRLIDESEAAGEADPFWQAIPEPRRSQLRCAAGKPPLNREAEIVLCRKIEATRKRFCREVLACDYAVRKVWEKWQQLRGSNLPGLPAEFPEKERWQGILARLPELLETVERLLAENREDMLRSLDAPVTEAEARRLYIARRRRCRRAARLVAETHVRTALVWSFMKELVEISARMQRLEKQAEAGQPAGGLRDGESGPEADLRQLILDTGETPTCLRERVRAMQRLFARCDRARRALHGATFWLIVAVARRYHNALAQRGIDFLSLLPECEIRLMKAVDHYDYRRGYKFSTYAVWWIRAAITRALGIPSQ